MTTDAWFTPPMQSAIEGYAARRGLSFREAGEILLKQREERIALARKDPLRHGWEPSFWWVAWALLGYRHVGEGTRKYLAQRLGVDEARAWQDWQERVMKVLGFPAFVRDMLANGANRSGKTDFAAKTTMGRALGEDHETLLFLAGQEAQSKQTLQPRLHKYMPPEHPMGKDKDGAYYVKYNDMKGFAEAEFMLRNGTTVRGKFYSQDHTRVLEGCETPWAWADELITPEWAEALQRRVASRRGQMLLTFTPIEGYTPVVKSFQDGMTVVRTVPAWLLPKDGGEQLPHRALGVTRAEYEELRDFERRRRMRPDLLQCLPSSRPEDCVSWVDGAVLPDPDAAELRGRVFETTARVARCFDERRAVLWFGMADNPYSSPLELLERYAKSHRDEIRKYLYGVALKLRTAMLARYDEGVHVVEDAEIPEEGANYCLMDPAGERNFALLWIRSTPGCDYVYREWPGNYHIPGIGVPGPWAKTSGRNKGWNDGDKDEGQSSFGFGLLRYKLEIARLEGWEKYRLWAETQDAAALADGDVLPDEEELESWLDPTLDRREKARERMEGRYVDSRAASAPRVENDRPVTMLTELCELGMEWVLTPGDSVDKGMELIVDALDWSKDGAGGWVKRSKFKVARSCVNTRFALAAYTGADGKTGAVKDWVDLLRYFFKAGLALCGEAPGQTRTEVERHVPAAGANARNGPKSWISKPKAGAGGAMVRWGSGR